MPLDYILDSLRRYRNQINNAIAALEAERAPATAAGRRGPRRMSAAARKRISEAQKARWAKQKKR